MTSAAEATTTVHSVGSSVAASSPAPNHTADLIFCLRHFILPPFISVYRVCFCVHEIFGFIRLIYRRFCIIINSAVII